MRPDPDRMFTEASAPHGVPRLTVWDNTKCPVCDGGITWHKRRLIKAARTRAIQFRDINLEPEALATLGVTLEDIRRRLHALDDDGRLYVGIDCVVAMWRRTPGMAWLSHIVGLPAIRQLSGFIYDRFADALYAWNRRKGHW